MKQKAVVGLATALIMLGVAGMGQADPVPWSTNGHYYEAIAFPSGITWNQARTIATNATYLGVNGHLATITSMEENTFIINNLGGASVLNGFFLGGFQPTGSLEPGGNWQWITGEIWDFENWTPGEPNNAYSGGAIINPPGEWGPEEVLHLWANNGTWNDVPQASGWGGFVVEYEPDSNSIPEYTLNIVIEGLGTVSIDPTDADNEYMEGSVVQISAQPSQDWEFVRWEGDVANTSSSTTTVTMDQAQSIKAVFSQNANQAGPIQWTTNGHYYEAIAFPSGITWDQARAIAENSTYLGLHGHLATITSMNENYFIVNNLGGASVINGFFLGGFQPTGSSEPGGNWQWITGEIWDFENWYFTAPNDEYSGGAIIDPLGDSAGWWLGPEEVLHLWANNGTWNDVPEDSGWGGLIVEYEPDFDLIPSYPLEIIIEGLGTVSIDPTDADNEYMEGSVVQISAQPSQDWEFVRWEGDVANTSSSTTPITMDQAQSIKAVFQKANSQGGGGGGGCFMGTTSDDDASSNGMSFILFVGIVFMGISRYINTSLKI